MSAGGADGDPADRHPDGRGRRPRSSSTCSASTASAATWPARAGLIALRADSGSGCLRRLRLRPGATTTGPTWSSSCRWRSRRSCFGRISRRLAEQSEQLARQAERLREQAVRAERDRIARELHDVIAHSVSAMVVQTAAAQDLVRIVAGPRPDAAGVGGRDRAPDAGRDRPAAAPDPRRVRRARAAAGARCRRPARAGRRSSGRPDWRWTRRLDLPDDPLPGGVDVSAYRIVQEALTNALKHADGAARLSVADARPAALRIRCANRIGPGTRHRFGTRPGRDVGAGGAARRDAQPGPQRRPVRDGGGDSAARGGVPVTTRGGRRRPGLGAVRARAGAGRPRLLGGRAPQPTVGRRSTWSGGPAPTWC